MEDGRGKWKVEKDFVAMRSVDRVVVVGVSDQNVSGRQEELMLGTKQLQIETGLGLDERLEVVAETDTCHERYWRNGVVDENLLEVTW